MKYILKILNLISILIIGTVAVIWSIDIINRDQAFDYGKKVLGVMGILILVSLTSRAVLGGSNKKENSPDDDLNQGPNFK